MKWEDRKIALTLEEYAAEVREDRLYRDFISENGVAYSYSHTWSEKPGTKTSIRGGPFATHEEALDAKSRALKAFGYTRPRWWQCWRWGEHVPEIRGDIRKSTT